MDEFGQIRYLGQAIRPDVAVITIIDDVHLSHFGSREDILKAKSEIFENLRPGGIVLLRGNGAPDPLQAKILQLRDTHPAGRRLAAANCLTPRGYDGAGGSGSVWAPVRRRAGRPVGD